MIGELKQERYSATYLVNKFTSHAYVISHLWIIIVSLRTIITLLLTAGQD